VIDLDVRVRISLGALNGSLAPNTVKGTRSHWPTSADVPLRCGSLLAHATGFVAQELLVIVQIAVEGLDAALGDQPELVANGAQQRGRD
jgi:hypothetical protein